MSKLGSGARFKSLTKKLAAKGVTNPPALAAWIGRKKYGAKKMAGMSAAAHKAGFAHKIPMSSMTAGKSKMSMSNMSTKGCKQC